ncbi:TetR/AcrR family transcriptional regulator [Nitrincola sp.]|uniref:TetR/AcrR family transcriptional regulator n=1 Tax=Nitrincola sp. TaxID=1926584 RepID=UPI003A8E6D6A
MRTSREESTRNREKIIGAAGKLFRERGLDGVSVAEIMATAGLTHGGFYRHFPSKEALAAEACAQVAERTDTNWCDARDAAAQDALRALIDRYLTTAHRDTPSQGCIYAALGCEVGRSSDESLHQTFADGLEGLINILAEASPEPDVAERRRAAIGRFASMAGALILARATRDTPLSDELLSETHLWLESTSQPVRRQ